MPEDYKKVVFDAYKRKKLEGNLSSNLLNPTPGNLRAECLIVCRERYKDKDHEVLRLFFSGGSREKGYINSIENSKSPVLRQMSEILKGANVKNPGVRYFELLAWLIDLNIGTETSYYKSFYNNQKDTVDSEIKDQPDPESEKTRDASRDSEVPVSDTSNTTETKPKSNEEDDGTTSGELKEKAPKVKVSIIFKISISFILIFILSIGYAFWKKNKDKTIREAGPLEQCMYWTGEHYEPVNCNDNDAAKLKLSLNKAQLTNQQKITLPDTLTSKSLGKVWYGKTNGKPQFYTDSGTNPLDTAKRLMPLTQYILNKYVSYDRYLLNMLTWSVPLLILFGLLVGVAYYFRPKKTTIDQS